MKLRLIFLLGGLLAGCAHYQPQPLAPEQSAAQLDARRLDDAGLKNFVATNAIAGWENWPPEKWNLDSLTLAALYFHPGLAVARAQWQLAEAGVATAGGRPNPSLNLVPGFSSTTATPSPWLPMVDFDLPLETAGKRAKRIAAAEAGASAAWWNYASAAWQIRAGVRGALLEWADAQHRLPLLQKQLAAQREIVQLLQASLAAGETARPELITAQLALSKAQLDFSGAEAKAAVARARLAGAVGVSSAALAGVAVENDFSSATAVQLTSAEARRAALLGRADIRAALADYAAAENDLRLEIAKQYPDVHLNPGYQYDQGNSKWTLGITFDLPVLNQNQGPIAEAKARRELAAAKFLQLQAQIAAQVDQAVAGWQSAQAQLKTAGELASAAERQQQSVTAQVRDGAAARMELAAAEIELAASRLAQFDSKVQAQAALGALEDAVQQPAEHFDLLKTLSPEPNRSSHP